MSAILIPPTPSDTRSAIADWMELQALASPRGRSTPGTLSRILDLAEDDAAEISRVDEETGEILDEAILEESRTAVVTATFEELEYRQRVLGTAYPFGVNSRSLVLEVTAASPLTEPGHVVYLFCLLASVIRERKVQPAAELGDAELRIANAFQVCACLAAGGYVSGEVCSFGFPRAAGDAFLPALRDAFQRFGAGQVRAEVPEGLPRDLKDGGIDVIAWRDHPDEMPGKVYMLGQCASGQNWQQKSIKEYIEQLHSWFTDRPAVHSIPAMFIPFTFHRDMGEVRTGTFSQAVRNAFWFQESRFGIIFDRLRIAHFAERCIRTNECRIDGADQLEQVQAWVEEALERTGVWQRA